MKKLPNCATDCVGYKVKASRLKHFLLNNRQPVMALSATILSPFNAETGMAVMEAKSSPHLTASPLQHYPTLGS